MAQARWLDRRFRVRVLIADVWWWTLRDTALLAEAQLGFIVLIPVLQSLQTH